MTWTQMVLGTNVIDATLGNARMIAGIQIDNPSGSWLFVTGIDQYVPPYTSGWSYPVAPQQPSISIKFTDSPSGSLSTLIGNPPTYTLFDTPVPVDSGFPSGAGARVTIVPPFQTTYVGNVIASRLGTNTLVLAAVTRPIIIREIGFLFDPFNGSTLPGGWFEEQSRVIAQWEVGANPYGLPIIFTWRQAISLENPYVTQPIADGAVRIPIGSALWFNAYTTPQGGSEAVIPQVQYYEEAA